MQTTNFTSSGDNSSISEDDESIFGCSPYGNLNRSGITDATPWAIRSSLRDVRFLLAAIEILFCVLAMAGNLFIVVTMLAKRQMLREPANVYLLNLAIADLLIAVIVLPFTVVAGLANEFVFGSSDYTRCISCNFAGASLQVLTAASLHLIAALSFDRFFALAYPLKYIHSMKRGKALSISLGIWFVSFWIGVPPILGFGQYTFNRTFANCHPVWEGDDFNYVRFVLFESFIPIAILLVTNVWTYRLASIFLKKRLRRRTITRKEEGPERLKEERDAYRTKQKRLIKMFTTLLLVYVVTWTPNVLIAVVANFVPNRGVLEVAVFGWICYITNPVLHPLIETVFIKELREEVSKARKWIATTWRKLLCVCACSCSSRTNDATDVVPRLRIRSCIAGEVSKLSLSAPDPNTDSCSTPQGSEKLLERSTNGGKTTLE